MDRAYQTFANDMPAQGTGYSSSMPSEKKDKLGAEGEELVNTAVEHPADLPTKTHKQLPHLGGRRMYQAEVAESDTKPPGGAFNLHIKYRFRRTETESSPDTGPNSDSGPGSGSNNV